jgi:hypothetical protein
MNTKKFDAIAESITNEQFEQARKQAKGISYQRLIKGFIDMGASNREAIEYADKAKGK